MDQWKKTLGRHVIVSALELPNSIEDHTPNDVEWDYDNWTIEDVSFDGTLIEVVGSQPQSQSAKRRRATRWQPAEYETFDGKVIVVARMDWSENHLAGEGTAMLEYEGGKPQPPDPDPHTI